MLTEDYLIRMINLAIAALLRLIGLKKDGDLGEAQQLIDLTLEQLLGLNANVAKNLDDERLYFLLTRGGQLDLQRLEIVAELFGHEGDILAAQNRPAESRAAYARALKYLLEVFFNSAPPDQAALRGKIDPLAGMLELPGLGADVLWPLAGYFEGTGALRQAETALLALAGQPEARAEILPEVADFYRRMSALPAPKLAAGGLELGDVKEKAMRWGR